MTKPKPRAEPNAGAFMGPDIMVPVPMGKLGTDYPPDRPERLAGNRTVQPRGWLSRVVHRLFGRSDDPR
jgi:hypothetical protein